MNKIEKNQLIEELVESLTGANIFYLADAQEMTAEADNLLRRRCFSKSVKMRVVKNSLLKKAMEKVEGVDFSELIDVLKGPTAIMFADVANVPAKVIQEFRKKNKKPLLKAAFIDQSVYIGDEHLDSLAALKSKEELVGDIIMLLQSPMKNVIGALKSSGNKIAGLVKALEEKKNN